MPKLFKDAFILCLITLTAGALLAGVYEITKEPIRIQEELAKTKACQEVFKDAQIFEENVELLTSTQKAVEAAGYTGETIDSIMYAKDANGNVLGYVFQVCEANGYGGDITFMVGIQMDQTVNGISILSINETAGLGMNATKPAFSDQFKDKQVEQFEYTKTGSTKENEIDAISGATVTTKAMVNGTNACISAFKHVVKEGK